MIEETLSLAIGLFATTMVLLILITDFKQ